MKKRGVLFSCHKSTADLKIGWLRCSWICFTYRKCSSVLFVAGHCTFQEVVDWKHSLHTAHLLGENGSKLVSHQLFSVPTFATQHCLKPFKFSKHQYHCDADLHILYSSRAGSNLRNFWFPAESWDPQTMIWSVIPLHTDLYSGSSYFTLVSSLALLAFPSCIG